MTVENQFPYQSFIANGEESEFALSFYIEDKANVRIKNNGVDVSQSDFSYIKSSNTITFSLTPNAGDQIEIERVTSSDRSITYATYNNSFRPEILNYDLDRIWIKFQELGVVDWGLGNRINTLKNYVDLQDGFAQTNINNLKNYVDAQDFKQHNNFTDLINKQGVSLNQLSGYYRSLLDSISKISVDKGWFSNLVVDAETGKSVQESINDLVTTNPTLKDLSIPTNGEDVTAAFQALLDTKIRKIQAMPSDELTLTAKTYIKSDLYFNGNGCTIYAKAPMQTEQMPAVSITSLIKGEKTITVSDASIFNVYDDILVYYNEDNSDTWYVNNQTFETELGITSQRNQIIDINGNTLTLKYANISKLSSDTTKISRVHKIVHTKAVIENVNFILTGTSFIFLYCSPMSFKNCTFSLGNGATLKSISFQTCYLPELIDSTVLEGLSIGFNYGSYLPTVINNTFYSGRSSDGLLITYAGTYGLTSRDNKFIFRGKETVENNAGLYIGAKSRSCSSFNDKSIGMGYGYRVMFGAIDTMIRDYTADDSITYAGFHSYDTRTKIYNFKASNSPIRTVGADQLTIDGLIITNSSSDKSKILLDFNRGSDTSLIRNNYSIKNVKIDGSIRMWLGVTSLYIENVTATQFDQYANAKSANAIIKNLVVAMARFSYLENAVIKNCVMDNTINSDILGEYALQLRGNTYIKEFEGNKVVGTIYSIQRETDGVSAYIAIGNNDIQGSMLLFANTSVTPPNSALNALVSLNTMIYDPLYNDGSKYFRWGNGSWNSEFLIKTLTLSYNNSSFNNVPNGIVTFQTTRTITGAEIGDSVAVISTNDDLSKGQYFARVTAKDTVTIYYKDFKNVQETIPSSTIKLTLNR